MDQNVFMTNPLVAALLRDPQYSSIQTFGKHSEGTSDRFGFFGGTLATPKTIPNRLILCRRILPPPPTTRPAWPESTINPLPSQPSVFPPDVIVLFDLGNPGLSGHPSIAHGGAIASCLDETMHKAIEVHLPGSKLERPYTAQLDIQYARPVRTPGLLVIRAKVVAKMGRKFWVRAHASQEVDTREELFTTDSIALFVMRTPSSRL